MPLPRRRRKDAKLHELRPELVASVHGLRGRIFEIEMDLRDDMICPVAECPVAANSSSARLAEISG
jgi:hypothetical protein